MTVSLGRLPNGLRIVTDRIDTVDTVSLGLWVEVGTRHEAPEVNGVAHFLEHMAFKGTERRSARAIAEEIEAVGGHLNAYTSRESTAYYAKVLKEDLPLALDILADILLHSSFEPAELERERTVILQEIGQANDTPDDIIFDHFQEQAFPDQAMGRPVLGRPEIIKKLSRKSVVAYLKEHYGAARMVLSASGNLDHDRIVDTGARIVALDRPPQSRRLDPHDGIGLRIEALAAAQRLDRDRVGLDALALVRCRTGPDALVTLSLPHPVTQCLARAADLLGNRVDRRPLRGVLGLVVQDHPNCAGAHLRGIRGNSLCHAPSSQELEPPGNPVWTCFGKVESSPMS